MSYLDKPLGNGIGDGYGDGYGDGNGNGNGYGNGTALLNKEGLFKRLNRLLK